LGQGRSGLGRPEHVSTSGATTSSSWISKTGSSQWAWLTVVSWSGFTSVCMVHGGLRPLLPPPLFGSQVPSTPISAAAPPSPSPLHGHAPAGDEGLISVPRRLNVGVQGLYSFARSLGTRLWGLGHGLVSLAGLPQLRGSAMTTGSGVVAMVTLGVYSTLPPSIRATNTT
jgi:hypothetical protein